MSDSLANKKKKKKGEDDEEEVGQEGLIIQGVCRKERSFMMALQPD